MSKVDGAVLVNICYLNPLPMASEKMLSDSLVFPHLHMFRSLFRLGVTARALGQRVDAVLDTFQLVSCHPLNGTSSADLP